MKIPRQLHYVWWVIVMAIEQGKLIAALWFTTHGYPMLSVCGRSLRFTTSRFANYNDLKAENTTLTTQQPINDQFDTHKTATDWDVAKAVYFCVAISFLFFLALGWMIADQEKRIKVLETKLVARPATQPPHEH